MINPNEPGITEQEKAFRKLINDIAFGRFKPLPEPTHNAPERKQ